MACVHPAPVSCAQPTPTQAHLTLVPVDTTRYSWSVQWMFFYMAYKRPIQAVIMVLLLSLLLVTILVSTRHSVSDHPCIAYQSDTLASHVSLTCFRYLWSRSCSQPLSDGYDGGWWLRSPNGGRMVPCLSPHTGVQCGAGSYSSIIIYLYRCRTNEDGL